MYVCFRCRSVRQCLVRRCKAGTYLFVLFICTVGFFYFMHLYRYQLSKTTKRWYLPGPKYKQIENKTTHTVKQELYQTEKQKQNKQNKKNNKHKKTTNK